MEAGMHKNIHDNWEMPLPSRHKDPLMPNNRIQALNHFTSLFYVHVPRSDKARQYNTGRVSHRQPQAPQHGFKLGQSDGGFPNSGQGKRGARLGSLP